jgi:hypothetical protein
MDHEEARRKKVGGKVLGFFYQKLTKALGSSSRMSVIKAPFCCTVLSRPTLLLKYWSSGSPVACLLTVGSLWLLSWASRLG